MVDSGALEGEPVELLEGLLVEVMSPPERRAMMVIERLTRHLGHAQAWLRVQLPLEVPPDSVPEGFLIWRLSRGSRRQGAIRGPWC